MAPVQIHMVCIDHLSIGSLVLHPKGDNPIQEEPKAGAYGMVASLHENETALGDSL